MRTALLVLLLLGSVARADTPAPIDIFKMKAPGGNGVLISNGGSLTSLAGGTLHYVLTWNGSQWDSEPAGGITFPGTTTTYLRGDNTFQLLNTSVVPEGSNLYYTDARADARITLQAGAANGLATLDSSGHVPTAQIPAALLGSVNYQGAWNATTNVPTIVSSIGTKGYYYVVSNAGTTAIDGVSSWKLGDWIVFDGSKWDKIDNSQNITSVNGFTGVVNLTTTDVTEGNNLYYTDARVRAALNASSPLTFNSATGILGCQTASGTQTGCLSSTDWSTFNAKEPAISGTTSADYYRGDKTFQNLNTAVRGALSATSPATYNSTTGALGVQSASDAQAGVISAQDYANFDNDPSYVINVVENFCGYASAANNGLFQSVNAGSGSTAGPAGGALPLDNGHICGDLLKLGTTATGGVELYTGTEFILGGGQVTYETLVRFPVASDGTNRYIARFGMGTDYADFTSDFQNGAYVEYSDNINGGNWVFKTATSGARTVINSSVPVTTGAWTKIRITCSPTSCTATADGVTLGTSSTTIPTTVDKSFGLGYQFQKTLGTTDRDMYVNYTKFREVFTTPR